MDDSSDEQRVKRDGERVYASAQQIFQGVDHMRETVAGGRLDPRGVLRVTTSFRLGCKHIGPALSLLAQRYPALDITLDAVGRRVDLINENVDLDVRIGDVDEPHLVAHRIADSTRVLCAAPSHLERRGVPASIAERSQHDCLVLRDRNQAFGVWRLAGPNGTENVKVTGRLSSNNSEIVRGWGNARCRSPAGQSRRAAPCGHWTCEAPGSQVAKELRCTLPVVVAAVGVGDGQGGQLFVGDASEAPQVDPVHLSNGRLGSDAKGTNAAMLAEVVLVLLGVEEVLG